MIHICLTFLFVPIIIHAIRCSTQMQHESNCVHMPIWFLVLGLCGGFITCVAIIVSIFVQLNQVAIVLLVSITIISLALLLGYFSCRIQYNEEYICVTKLFSVKKYTYHDIRGIKFRGNDGFSLITQKGNIHIDGFALGKEKFYEFIEQILADNQCAVSVIENRLFNGYVLAPEQFVIFLGLPYVGLIILSAMASWELVSIHIPQNLITTRIVFESAERDNNSIVFRDSEAEYWILADAINDSESVLSAVLQSKAIVLKYQKPTETDNTTVNRIWYLEVDAHAYASPESVFQARFEDGLRTITMLWCVTLAWMMFMSGVFYVLSHAPQYPRLAAMIVKKEYLNF